LPTVEAPSVSTPVAEVDVSPAPIKVVLDEHPAPTKFDDALAEGRALLGKGEHARAKDMLEAAIKLDKKHAEPYIELARLYIATNERGKAVAAATKAVKLAPLSSQAWNTKGRAELNRFDYDSAIEAFSKSVELNRDNVWAWNNLGYVELVQKKYDVAAEHFLEATSHKGATGYMFNNLGTALEQLDRLDDARKAFEAGASLGSSEAASSRKRLEGVKTIAIAKKDAVDTKVEGKSYDLNEGVTDEDKKIEEGAGSGSGSDVKVEPPKTGGGDGSDAGPASSTM
jgi:tetratricopeptide (TPR) repeat protein